MEKYERYGQANNLESSFFFSSPQTHNLFYEVQESSPVDEVSKIGIRLLRGPIHSNLAHENHQVQILMVRVLD